MDEPKTIFRRISKGVLENVARAIESYVSNSSLRSYAEVVLRRKLVQPYETRIHWMYVAYCLTGGTEWDTVIPIATAYELLLLAQYHLNMVFDKKGPLDIQNAIERNNLIIGAELLKSLSERVIFDSTYPHEMKLVMISRLNNLYFRFMEGQFSDLNHNRFEVQEQNFELSFQEPEYWRRVCLINAWMYRSITKCVLMLNRDSRRPYEHAMVKFSLLYGFIIQLVNDIIDFVPTSLQSGTAEKEPLDAYADIRNRHVTLPFYYFWQRISVDERRDFVRRFDLVVDPRNEELARWMVRTGAIGRAQENVHRIARQCRQLIRQFPADYHKVLGGLLHIAYSNRFFKALKALSNKSCSFNF